MASSARRGADLRLAVLGALLVVVGAALVWYALARSLVRRFGR